MERTNMRYMTEDDIDEKASFVSIMFLLFPSGPLIGE